MLNRETKRKIILDVILVVTLLAVSLSAFFIFRAFREEGAVAVVTVDGKLVAEYPLSQDGEFSLNGGTNILVIKDGEAYMLTADCPDGTCVRKGRISYTGEDITCLPNRVRVEIMD